MISFGNSAQHRARVLIVDDQTENQDLLEVMLGPEGYLIDKASSGEEAMARVKQDPPDLILLDVMMPTMNGFEVARALKGSAATQHIPIILVTAVDDRQSRLTGLVTGAEEYLSKPVDRAELCARVRNLLRLKSYGEYYSKHSQALESEVAARTADLEARTAAFDESRDLQLRFRDEFFSHVSHELRSPLTAIKMFSTILADGLAGGLSHRQLECQQIVIKNVAQLEVMIDDLLQVTGLETGKLHLQHERVTISPAVTGALNALRLPAGGKGITLSAEPTPDLPTVYSGPDTPASDPGDPARQRRQVHRGRRPHQRDGPGARPGPAVPDDQRLGHRVWGRARARRQDFRTSLPGRGRSAAHPEVNWASGSTSARSWLRSRAARSGSRTRRSRAAPFRSPFPSTT